MMYLMAGNFSAGNTGDVNRLERRLAAGYAGWREVETWLHTTILPMQSESHTDEVNFKNVAQLATNVGEKYYQFNDLECKSLKETLGGMEGRKAGRVRLPVFYKAGLYSHWRFTEKIDYLRTIGALDEP